MYADAPVQGTSEVRSIEIWYQAAEGTAVRSVPDGDMELPSIRTALLSVSGSSARERVLSERLDEERKLHVLPPHVITGA